MKERLENAIRNVPDFPKPGIQFKDITPILMDAALMKDLTVHFAERYRAMGVDAIVGVESRGFLFGVPLAMELGIPFVLVRKPGKLPWKTRRVEYALEYGTDALEIHEDALSEGQKVVVVDDLLATGGTLSASIELVESIGGSVAECALLVELAFLKGRERLAPTSVYSLLTY